MSDQTFDLRYASRDEHFALRERVAVLETEIKPALTRIENKLNAQPQANGDHMYLMGRELISEIKNAPKAGMNPLLLVALGAALAVIAMFFIQGKPW